MCQACVGSAASERGRECLVPDPMVPTTTAREMNRMLIGVGRGRSHSLSIRSRRLPGAGVSGSEDKQELDTPRRGRVWQSLGHEMKQSAVLGVSYVRGQAWGVAQPQECAGPDHGGLCKDAKEARLPSRQGERFRPGQICILGRVLWLQRGC